MPDDVPTFRGKMVRECEIDSDGGDTHRRRATSGETKRYLTWAEKRGDMGYPPWISEIEEENYANGSVDADSTEVPHTLRSSKTLRQWADEYCASPKYFKEFVYEKVLSTASLVLLFPYSSLGSLQLELFPTQNLPPLTHPLYALQRRPPHHPHAPLF